MTIASKRRQGDKVETHSDLLRGLEGAEVEEVVIAVIRGERNQEEQGASQQQGLTSLGDQGAGAGWNGESLEAFQRLS